MSITVIFYILSLHTARVACDKTERMNLVIIVADDIGYDDISLHGSNQIQTPNIDTLGYQGVIMSNYYTNCLGTASASALFTGKYPMKMGTQGPSIEASEDRGVPITERLLPSYLKDLGYNTHLVGKWPLGKSRQCYLPLKRGFETFYGFTSPVDYYTYNYVKTYNGTDYFGLDFFDNYDPVRSQGGHLTNMLTKRCVKIIQEHDTSSPLYLHVGHAAAHVGGGLVNLQAPGEDVAVNSHIAHSARRLYAGLVSGIDKSVGAIVQALAKKGILNNTLIVFVSDNGASSIGISRNYGSNLPLRGTKGTPWEGAVRTTAIAWHADINPKIWKGLVHVTDWFPTVLAAAGGDIPEDIDGINQWGSIARDEGPKRHHAIIAVDDINKWGAFRDGDYKIIIGNVPNTCGYYGHELSKLIYDAPDYEQTLISSTTFKVLTEYLNMGLDVSYALEKRNVCNLNMQKSKSNDTAQIIEICVPTDEKGCLYNITADPEESYDLWNKYPEIAQHMVLRLRMLWTELVPRPPSSFDPRADPSNNSYVWLPWMEDDDASPALITEPSEYPMKISSKELIYFMNLNALAMKQKLSDFLKSLTISYVASVNNML